MNRRKMMAMAIAAVALPSVPMHGYASGGMVRGGRGYLIGEHCSPYVITGDRGPELFIPHKPGQSVTIIPVYPKPKLG